MRPTLRFAATVLSLGLFTATLAFAAPPELAPIRSLPKRSTAARSCWAAASWRRVSSFEADLADDDHEGWVAITHSWEDRTVVAIVWNRKAPAR